MSQSEKQNRSFYRKVRISLALMGVLPFLLSLYLFIRETQASKPSTFLILCSALILFSMLVGFTLLRKSSDQMRMLAQKTAIPEPGLTPEPLDLQVEGELQDIALNFNAVVEQLNQANRDIRSRTQQLKSFATDLSASYQYIERENSLRDQLCRYVDKDLVERLVHSRDGQLLRNERKSVTIMFADIRSFTAISEHMTPEAVVSMLNQYFTTMTDILFKHNGMLDKFVGDQLMAVFGHISDERNGAIAAVRAALKMQKATLALMRERANKGLPVFQIGIGINTGIAILASVGSTNRQDYTVIGDEVNIAARLEKYAGGREIVIGERTAGYLPIKMPSSVKHELPVKNRLRPLACYVLRPDIRKKSVKLVKAKDAAHLHRVEDPVQEAIGG